MYKARFACFLAGALLCGGFAFSQNDDIEITDSTSVDWGGGAGGGITPNIPDEPVTSLSLSQTSLTVEMGRKARLVATVNPRAKNKKILWMSADSNIASVEEDGTVTGITVGTTSVTATAEGNTALKRTCLVTVIPKTSPVARYNVVLPDVPFEFFYDARNYDPDEHCIPNHKEANLKGTMLQLTENLPAIVEEGKALRISDRCEGYLDRWDKWSNESGAHFFRQGQDCMTIVAKVAPRQTSNASDFISNRGANYNYMWRIGSDYNISFLHTGTAYANDRALFLHSEEPQVLAVRVDGANDYILLQNLTTKEQLRIDGVNWGGGDNVFKVFYNDGGEFYLGDFYWVYYTFELLTDDQLALFGTSDFEDGISAPQRQASADSIYDICGRKVAAPVGGGIYIIKGRKILIR